MKTTAEFMSKLEAIRAKHEGLLREAIGKERRYHELKSELRDVVGYGGHELHVGVEKGVEPFGLPMAQAQIVRRELVDPKWIQPIRESYEREVKNSVWEYTADFIDALSQEEGL